MMTQQPGKREAETALWEQHKKTIEFMFLTQDNTLIQVRDIMANQFMFERTAAQYERRFKTWGFRKNLTSKEWKHAHSIIERRKFDGKRSLITSGSARIHGSTMQRRAKRHSYETTLERIERLQTANKGIELTAKSLVIRTPSPGPSVGDRQQVIRHDQIQDFAAPSVTKSLATNSIPVQDSKKLAFSASIFTNYIHNIDYTRKLLLAVSPCGIAMNIDETLALRTGEAWADLLKASIFLLSNNLDEQTHIGKLIVESCQLPKNLQMLERLLRLKQPTIQAFAERLLTHAAAAGDTSLAELILQNGIHPNGPLSEKDSMDALGTAIRNGRVAMTALLIDAGADLNRVSPRHGTYLMIAFESNCLEIAHLLLLHKVNVKSDHALFAEYGVWNALCNATIYGGINAVKLLAKHNKAIFQKMMYQGEPTPLELAASIGNEAVMRLFLEHGGNINHVNAKGYGSALSAAISNGKSRMTHLLLSVGANVNTHSALVWRKDVYETWWSADYRRASPLQEAVWRNDSELTRTLLHQGADANPRLLIKLSGHLGDIGLWKTPLALAVLHGNDSLVKLLLEAGADINVHPFCPVRDIHTLSPLNYATLAGDVSIIKLLLDHGSRPDETTLVLASQSGLLDFVQFLLYEGICINAAAMVPSTPSLKDRDSPYVTKSVLTAAIWSENEELVELLLRKGVNVNNPSIDQEWETPLSSAIESERLDWVRALIAHGADPRDSCALCAAVRTDQPIVLEILLGSCQKQFGHGLGEFALPSLIRAFENDNANWVHALIGTGIPLNTEATILYYDGFEKRKTEFFGLPLTCAALVASPNIVNLLIDHGADPSSCLLSWFSNLRTYRTIEEDRTIRTFKILLNAGAEIDLSSNFQSKYPVPLVFAIEQKCHVLVNLLLQHGADVNSRSLLKRRTATPLQAAAYHGFYSIVRKLLELGANIYAPAGEICDGLATSPPNGTAIELAAEKGRLDVLCLLLEAGAGQEHQFIACYATALRTSYKSGFRAISECLRTYRREECGHLNCPTDEEILSAEGSDEGNENNREFKYTNYTTDRLRIASNGKGHDGGGGEAGEMTSGSESKEISRSVHLHGTDCTVSVPGDEVQKHGVVDTTNIVNRSHVLDEVRNLQETMAAYPSGQFDPTNIAGVVTRAIETKVRNEPDYDAMIDEFFEREIYELFE